MSKKNVRKPLPVETDVPQIHEVKDVFPNAIDDSIDHPEHYNNGDIECIDAIYSALGKDGGDYFCTGNALKYLWRWRKKNGLEDIRKARWYIDRMIGDEHA